MNLLKQTSLILGLASLSIGVWTLYRNWKQKLAITFTVLCIFISIWALSFVSYATLEGRLSKDIHWFFHVWLVPVGVTILSKILSREDNFSRFLRWASLLGAIVLSLMISFSLGSGRTFWFVVSFWPLLVVFEFIYVMAKDLFLGVPVSVDFFSPSKRIGLYFGLATSLITCSFDHIPELGFTIPAMGNLLLTVYLVFISQLVSPQKILSIQALATRFFATVILSLVITGFFALLYQYMSESFPLFFLNSFLVTFAVLILWNPLITFLRFLGRKISVGKEQLGEVQLNKFLTALPTITDRNELQQLLQKSFSVWIPNSQTKIWILEQNTELPEVIEKFFHRNFSSSLIPVIHRELIQMEKDQVVTNELRNKLDQILEYLNLMEVDVIFPVYSSNHDQPIPIMFVLVSAPVSIDDWHGDFSLYSKIFRSLQEVEKTLVKIGQINYARERDRLILLGEMAAGLAHEVRNPLGAIQGASNLIASSSDPWVKVIQDEVQRLNRLVNQFLEFAHAPGDQLEELNLGESLQRSIQNLSELYGKQAEIEFVNHHLKPVLVMGVPDHLQQILMNLIQNSLKAQAKNIKVELLDSGFSVKDDGIGMSEEVKSRVFQPFFTTFKTGTGLGLSICERLVKFSQGEISLDSTEGVGTEVKIKLCEIKSSSLMTNRTSEKS
jgi:two-component system sensor histidine kinase HydH